jgi:hypothetical protein
MRPTMKDVVRILEVVKGKKVVEYVTLLSYTPKNENGGLSFY